MLKNGLKKLENWLLPPTCVVSNVACEDLDLSNEQMDLLCVPNQVCPRCCEPSRDKILCGACLTQPPAFSKTQAAYYFDPPLDTLIYGLKYHQQMAYARLLAKLMAPRMDASGVEGLMPIPLHPLRRRKRGYNQAMLLAKALGQLLEIPVITDGLYRTKHTASQTQLSALKRQANLKGAFTVIPEYLIGKTELSEVALIDDVITTGATMQAVAQVLLKNTSIQNIQAWSVAKTK